MSDYYIVDELLTKILTYLPAKSLLRFTCVCKSWQSLITSSDFITTHRNQTRALNNNNHLLLVRYCQKILDNERISLHIDNDTSYLCEKLDFPFQCSESDFNVYGFSNGLILLSNDIPRKNTLMLWNPTIRNFLTLPRLRHMYLKHVPILGFGFDSRTNDHKVVRLVYHLKSKGQCVSLKVELYKLSTRSWETITATFDPSCVVYTNYLGQAFLDGAVHWGAYKMGSRIIMSFNMSDEEFSEIMLPPNFHMRSRFDIATCGEWLSVFHIPNYRQCSVWAMKEYGVVESWTKLYTLDLRHGELMVPLGFRKNGELLLRKLHGELLSYDHETQEIKYLGNSYACRLSCSSLCKFKVYMDAYVENLVLLGDANRLGAEAANQAKKKRKNRQDTVSLVVFITDIYVNVQFAGDMVSYRDQLGCLPLGLRWLLVNSAEIFKKIRSYAKIPDLISGVLNLNYGRRLHSECAVDLMAVKGAGKF